MDQEKDKIPTMTETVKERHSDAVKDLISIKQDLEDIEKECVSLIIEKDTEIKQAEDSISVSKEIEKNVEDLTIELLTTKELLVSTQSAHLGAEAHKSNPSSALEQDTPNCKAELDKAEAGLQHLNDLELKCNTASETLASLRAILDSCFERKLNQEEQSFEEQKLDGLTVERQANTPVTVTIMSKELDDIKDRIEKSRHEVNTLKTAISALKSELETEKISITTISQREGLTSTSLSSLEAELNKMNTELELIHTREKEVQERMLELPKFIQQAVEGANQAKALANSAQEELNNVKEDIEQAKAGANTEENNSSSKLENSSVKALEKSAQTNSVKESESASLLQPEKANEKLEEKKKELRAATDKGEKAQGGKLEIKQEQHRKDSDGFQSSVDFEAVDPASEAKSSATEKALVTKSSGSSFRFRIPRLLSTLTGSSSSESKESQKSFFPRIIMYLARKKAQSPQ